MTYEAECSKHGVFEFHRPLKERDTGVSCPICGISSRRIMSRVNFNTVFKGSVRAEMLAEDGVRESVRAQDEGFSSKTEIETAIGQAQDRAKQLGYGDRQLVGPVKSPFQGDKYQKSSAEQGVSEQLSKQLVSAAMKGDERKVTNTKHLIKEHEADIKKKASKVKQDFKPDRDTKALKAAVKDSQSRRGAAWS